MTSEAAAGSETGVETTARPVKRVRMSWTGQGMEFRGGAPGGPEIVVDGDSGAGPSPMDTLLIALATCMAADVRMILEKARVPLESLEIEVEGTRRATAPRRYEEIRLVYRVRGPLEEHGPRLDRAVQLSRDTYCSVLHTLRPDLDVEIAIERL